MESSNPTDIELDLHRDGANGAERAALWQDAMGLAGKIEIEDPDAFTGHFSSRSLGEMRTMSIDSRTFRFSRDRAMARRVLKDYVIVNLVQSGRFDGKLAGRRIVAEAGSVLTSSLGCTMDLLMVDAEWLALLLPRKLVEKHASWSSALDGRVFKAETVPAVIMGGLLRSLILLAEPLSARDETLALRSSLAVLAACFAGSSRKRTVGSEEHDLADHIRHFIGERLASPEMGVALICREFSISRSQLYRVMGDQADIATIIRRLRLRSAQRDIASDRFPHLSLADIGRRWGFADERNFRRAFVSEFGYPPSSLHKQAEGNIDSAVKDAGLISAELESWFLGQQQRSAPAASGRPGSKAS